MIFKGPLCIYVNGGSRAGRYCITDRLPLVMTSKDLHRNLLNTENLCDRDSVKTVTPMDRAVPPNYHERFELMYERLTVTKDVGLWDSVTGCRIWAIAVSPNVFVQRIDIFTPDGTELVECPIAPNGPVLLELGLRKLKIGCVFPSIPLLKTLSKSLGNRIGSKRLILLRLIPRPINDLPQSPLFAKNSIEGLDSPGVEPNPSIRVSYCLEPLLVPPVAESGVEGKLTRPP